MKTLQRTFTIVKPDAVKKNAVGDIIEQFEKNGFRIIAMKMLEISKHQAEQFYAVHASRPFYGSLTDFMSSGPIVVLALEKENAIADLRKLMGATNPANAEEGTIRKKWASSIEYNAIHGSDAEDTARFELSYFFAGYELARARSRSAYWRAADCGIALHLLQRRLPHVDDRAPAEVGLRDLCPHSSRSASTICASGLAACQHHLLLALRRQGLPDRRGGVLLLADCEPELSRHVRLRFRPRLHPGADVGAQPLKALPSNRHAAGVEAIPATAPAARWSAGPSSAPGSSRRCRRSAGSWDGRQPRCASKNLQLDTMKRSGGVNQPHSLAQRMHNVSSATPIRRGRARRTWRSRSASAPAWPASAWQFATATEWVARLGEAKRAGKLEEELRRLGFVPLIVVDEVGYIPFDPEAANLMFGLVSARYERASLIVTSNKPFSRLGRDLRRRSSRRGDDRPPRPPRRDPRP